MGSTKHISPKRNWNIGLEDFEESCREPNIRIEIQVINTLSVIFTGIERYTWNLKSSKESPKIIKGNSIDFAFEHFKVFIK